MNNEQEYIAGETCYRPEPSKCYYSPCGKIGKCVKDIPDYDPRKPIETYNGVSLNSIQHPEGNPVPDDHEINPDSLETMEIDIPVMPEDQLETWMHNMIRACNRSTLDSDINVLKLIQHIENLYEKGRADEREQADLAEQWDTSDMAHRSGGLSVEQAEKKPVTWAETNDMVCALLRQAHDVLACASYPFKRPWVGLTDEELVMYSKQFNGISLVSEIEAQLKERNNG
jgi:hypothetical protein